MKKWHPRGLEMPLEKRDFIRYYLDSSSHMFHALTCSLESDSSPLIVSSVDLSCEGIDVHIMLLTATLTTTV